MVITGQVLYVDLGPGEEDGPVADVEYGVEDGEEEQEEEVLPSSFHFVLYKQMQ